jgi:hypothetical protein
MDSGSNLIVYSTLLRKLSAALSRREAYSAQLVHGNIRSLNAIRFDKSRRIRATPLRNTGERERISPPWSLRSLEGYIYLSQQ